MRRERFSLGKVGQCCDVGDSPLVFRCAGNFRADEGACSFWICPQFRGDDTNLYCTFFGAADWGMLYKYLRHTSLTFGTAKADGDLYYDCSVPDISSWVPGQWHHVVVCWSRQDDARWIYVHDGDPTFDDVQISDCDAEYGAGIYLESSDAVMQGVDILDVAAQEQGGGIYMTDSFPILEDVTIRRAEADGDGGGMAILDTPAQIQFAEVANCVSHGGQGGGRCPWAGELNSIPALATLPSSGIWPVTECPRRFAAKWSIRGSCAGWILPLARGR